MLGFLGGLAGAAANLVGGLFGQRNQEQINRENIAAQQYQATHAIQERVADARAAGINPLAALGSSFQPGAATVVGSNALPSAMGDMGQNLSRAASALQDESSRKAKLELELLEAQRDQIKASTVEQMARASKIAQVVAPGTPPSLPYPWWEGGPVDPRAHKGMKNLTELVYDPGTGRTIEMLTPEASQQSMTSASLATNAAINARMLGGMVHRGAGALGEDLPVRPDFFRSLNTDNWWLWQQ